jgi:hypothetical protein
MYEVLLPWRNFGIDGKFLEGVEEIRGLSSGSALVGVLGWVLSREAEAVACSARLVSSREGVDGVGHWLDIGLGGRRGL